MKENGLLKIVRNINRVRQLLKNDIKVTIQDRFPLDKAQFAVDTYLNNMTGGKVLLVPGNKISLTWFYMDCYRQVLINAGKLILYFITIIMRFSN